MTTADAEITALLHHKGVLQVNAETLFKNGMTSVSRLAYAADTTAEVRAWIRGGVPGGLNITDIGQVAAIIDAYAAAKAVSQKRVEQQADSQSADLPRPLPRI